MSEHEQKWGKKNLLSEIKCDSKEGKYHAVLVVNNQLTTTKRGQHLLLNDLIMLNNSKFIFQPPYTYLN